MPFRVALNKLIKEVTPDRIFIEPAGAGHLQHIQHLLQGPFYQAVLNLQQSICVLTETQLRDSKYADNEGYLFLYNMQKRWLNATQNRFILCNIISRI